MSILDEVNVLPTFETDRLILRQITSSEQDGRECLEFINDYNVYRTWGLYDEKNHPSSKPAVMTSLTEHYQNTIEDFKNKEEFTWLLVLKSTNRVIGELILYDFLLDTQAEIGYRIRHDEWGKGYTFEAGQAILRYAFQTLGLNRLQIKCFANNPGSQRVAQKLGFRQEGFIRQGVILAVITDFYIYGLLREEYLQKEGLPNEKTKAL